MLASGVALMASHAVASEETIAACSNGIAVPAPEQNPDLVNDCAVLLDIRDTLAGDATLDWSASKPIEEWEGVGPSVGQVLSLMLSDKKLTGEIPPELVNLSNLIRLDLSENSLTGIIPHELSNLSAGTIFLIGNYLDGCIPTLISRTVADLPDCPLSPIDADRQCRNGIAVPDPHNNPGLVRDCTALLQMRHKISERFSWGFGWESDKPMTDWEGISISCCPDRVTRIIFTDMGHTYVTFKKVKKILPVSGYIPSEIALMADLEVLILSNIGLHGKLPPELGNLSHLRKLDLSGNRLTEEIPQSFGKLSNLQTLDLSHNKLTGQIPPQLGQIKGLKDLSLSWNQIDGFIPVEFSLLKFNYLWLHNNKLSSDLSTISLSAQWLRLSGNSFAGCIPVSLYTIPLNDLDRLDLPDCDLSLGETTPDKVPPDAAPPVTGTGLASDGHAGGVFPVIAIAVAVVCLGSGGLMLARRGN